MSDWKDAKRFECKHCGNRVYPHWRHHGSNMEPCYGGTNTSAKPLSTPPADAVQELPPLDVTESDKDLAWVNAIPGESRYISPGCLRASFFCRERQLREALAAKQLFESTVASQAEEMAGLRDEIDICRQLEYAKLPCGHNSRYGFTNDSGKTGYCVMCAKVTAEADNTRLREALTQYQKQAESWHNFHHGSAVVACDTICQLISVGRAALKPVEGGKDGE